MAHQRQGLQRLAEPHVVGEHAAEPVLVEEGQPVESGVLIGPEGGAQSGGRVVFGPVSRIGQGPDRGLPLAGLGGDHPEALEVLPQARLESTEADAVTRGVA